MQLIQQPLLSTVRVDSNLTLIISCASGLFTHHIALAVAKMWYHIDVRRALSWGVELKGEHLYSLLTRASN